MTALVVTGATGYIGHHLVQAAAARGWEVVAASRTRPADLNGSWIPYRLEDDLTADQFPMGATVIHLAADTRGVGTTGEELEIAAAQRLLDMARKRRLRVVFVSSQTARSDAPTAYGRAKWQVEQRVLLAGGKVARPGQVYGGRPGGSYLQLLEQVQGSAVLPALLPVPYLQPIHVADLVEGLLRIVEREDLPLNTYNLAAVEPVSFTSFLRALATIRLHRWRLFVPMPTVILAPTVFIANSLMGRKYDLSRVSSLTDLPMLSCADSLSALGLQLRTLEAGMQRSGSERRRLLLREGRCLITYLLGEPAPGILMRRYVRAVECVRDGLPAGIPEMILGWPCTMAVLDNKALLQSAGADELGWRLNAATTLAEFSTTGARRFLLIGDSTGAIRAMVSLAAVVLCEGFWRIVRLLASPLLRRARELNHGNR